MDRGYDKVILVSRDLISLCRALAKYHRKASTERELIELMLEQPNFFSNIQKKWNKQQTKINDPRLLSITLENWNNFTFQIYNKILDFVGFPKENRMCIIPVKMPERDFEGYSCSFLDEDQEVCENIMRIRNVS